MLAIAASGPTSMPDGQRWWAERGRAWARAQEVSSTSQRTYEEHLRRWPDSVAALGFSKPTAASAVSREMGRAFKVRGVAVRGKAAGQLLAPMTRAMDLCLLKSFLAFEGSKLALETRLFRVRSPEPVRTRWLSEPSDVDRLISAAADMQQLQGAIALMAHCGLRSAEVRAARAGDLSLSLSRTSWITVPNGKGGKPRAVSVPAAARNILLASMAGSGPSDRIYPWSRSKLAKDLLAVGQAAGVGRVSPHDLRRSYARFMRRANVKLEALQRQMGHRSPEVTLRYVGRDPDALEEAAAAYDRYLSVVGRH